MDQRAHSDAAAPARAGRSPQIEAMPAEEGSPVDALFGFLDRLFPQWIKDFWPIRTTINTVTLVRRNRVMGIAAEVSFWAVLSVVPLLLVIASALGWLDSVVGLDVAEDARRELTEQVQNLLGSDSTAFDAIDGLFESPAVGALTFGIITSVYASSRGFTSLVGGLDHIAGHSERRSWLMTRIVGFLVALTSTAALISVLVFVGVGRTGFGLANPWGDIVSIAMWPATFIGIIFWAGVLLHWAPRVKTPVLADLPGAFLTATAWLAGSWLTSLYLRRSSGGADVLGLLGSGVGLLIWLYVISASILIGAQLNVALRGQLAPATADTPHAETPRETPPDKV